MPERADVGHPVWRDIEPELKPMDFDSPYRMQVGFLRRLSRARRKADVPFRVVSDYRTPEQNREVGGAENSAHVERPGCAVDLRVTSNLERYRIVRACLDLGFKRIGVYPPTAWQRERYGKGAGSVHVDGSTENPAPRMWMSW